MSSVALKKMCSQAHFYLCDDKILLIKESSSGYTSKETFSLGFKVPSDQNMLNILFESFIFFELVLFIIRWTILPCLGFFFSSHWWCTRFFSICSWISTLVVVIYGQWTSSYINSSLYSYFQLCFINVLNRLCILNRIISSNQYILKVNYKIVKSPTIFRCL